jgi:hypothetical protein
MLLNIPKSTKPYLLAKRNKEILDLKKGIKSAIKNKKKIIYIDETIFLGKENKFKGWASKGLNV